MSVERYLSEKPWSHGVGYRVDNDNWEQTFGKRKRCISCLAYFSTKTDESLCQACRPEAECGGKCSGCKCKEKP